jgi:hypothetical protein
MYNLKSITMSENLENQGAAQRPAFLTVLCILSFISAGIAIILLLIATLFAGAVTAGSSVVDTSVMTAEGQAAVETAQGQIGNIWLYLALGVTMVIVSLMGVIKMWKLKKNGFYMYTGAAIAGIIVEIAVGTGFSPVATVFTVAFIVMYGLNLKHMN